MTNLSKFQGVQTTVATDRDGALVGYYRGTPVARLAGNVVTLNTGGWFSRTTKVRMNQFSHNFTGNKFGVYQKNYQWFATVNGQTLPFNGNTLTFSLEA